MSYYDELKAGLEKNDINTVIASVHQIGEEKCVEALPLLVDIMMKTDDIHLRHDIAIALKDIGSQEAVEPIITLLKDRKTEGSRGTLLYALEDLDYSAHFELLIEFLYTGNWETSRQAYMLLEPLMKVVPIDKRERGISAIKNAIYNQKDQLRFFKKAVKLLSKK